MEEIKKLLEPHFGHLDFLLRIKKEEISIEDISNLIIMINDRNLVINLPRDLHKYNSYYTLVKDLYFTKKNLFLLKEIKDNLSSEQKKIILELINSDDLIKSDLERILTNEELRSTFYRWSARIKNIEFAKNYIASVIGDIQLFKELNGSPSELIELKNYNTQSKYIPACWCIKNEQTFYNYLRNQRIFILKYKGTIYGINLLHNQKVNRLDSISIINGKNKSVYLGQDTNIDKVFKKAKSEILKFDVFGSNSSIEPISEPCVGTTKGILPIMMAYPAYPVPKKGFIKRIFG